MAKFLRAQADIVIAISHSGEKVDQQIATSVPGVDVIVGGHSHSRLPSGELVQHIGRSEARKIKGTIIVQAHQWGGELGRLDLFFNKDARGSWQIDQYHAGLIPVTHDIPEEENVAAVVDRYWKPIAARFGEIIGWAAADFVARGNDLAQYNLVADAIRETFGTEIEFENLGGVRSELIEGNITRGDLATLDPFQNTIVTFKLTGRQLKGILLKKQPAVSGVRYRIENGKLIYATIAGEPIDDSRQYSGAANSYFARTSLKGVRFTATGKERLDVLIEYVRKKGTIKPAYDGRRVIIEPTPTPNGRGF
jgi:5'-nucleotidase